MLFTSYTDIAASQRELADFIKKHHIACSHESAHWKVNGVIFVYFI